MILVYKIGTKKLELTGDNTPRVLPSIGLKEMVKSRAESCVVGGQNDVQDMQVPLVYTSCTKSAQNMSLGNNPAVPKMYTGTSYLPIIIPNKTTTDSSK